MRHWAFAAWIGAILGVTALQSELHLHVVLDDGRMGTMLDLDRSNGLPDLVSTLALASAAVGAALLSQREPHGRRPVPTTLAGFLAFLTLADVIHDGPHPVSPTGAFVFTVVVVTGALIATLAITSGTRTWMTLAVAGCLLLASLVVSTLAHVDPERFERVRGDPVTEYQIVAKEGLELLGWSLVALALWDEALRLRAPAKTASEPDSQPGPHCLDVPSERRCVDGRRT